MNKFVIGTIFILTIHHATSQNLKGENKIRSIKSFSFPIDTIQAKYKYYSIVRINWMDSIIEIDKTDRIKYDLYEVRKFRRDSIYVPSPSDTVKMNQWRTIGAQNCHSYALEKYFNSIQVDNYIFTKWTSLKENKYMNSILATSFIKTKSFQPKRKKCTDCLFDKGSIIVFRNKWDTPIHTVYFDGEFFHSKYGALPGKAESKIDNVIKKYWDTVTIQEYQFDNKKVAKFTDSRNKGS